jgi:hypothetical protein
MFAWAVQLHAERDYAKTTIGGGISPIRSCGLQRKGEAEKFGEYPRIALENVERILDREDSRHEAERLGLLITASKIN